jgi:hypothetical protein
LRIVVSEQERADEMTRALRVRPSHDDELGAVETLGLDPRAAVAREVGPVNPLGDDALQAVLAGRTPESLAFAALMLAVGDTGRLLLEQRGKPLLPFKERKLRNILPIEVEEVEGEVDEASEACCISSKEVTPSSRTPHNSPSMYAVFTGSSANAAAVAG